MVTLCYPTLFPKFWFRNEDWEWDKEQEDLASDSSQTEQKAKPLIEGRNNVSHAIIEHAFSSCLKYLMHF